MGGVDLDDIEAGLQGALRGLLKCLNEAMDAGGVEGGGLCVFF